LTCTCNSFVFSTLKGVEKVNIVQGVKAGALAVARVDTAISKNALSLLTGRQRGSRIHLVNAGGSVWAGYIAAAVVIVRPPLEEPN
jgi:hypothetical protein